MPPTTGAARFCGSPWQRGYPADRQTNRPAIAPLNGAMVERVRALIIVDVQNDFCAGGSLAVTGGAALVPRINDYLAGEPGYQHVVATKDCPHRPG